MGNGSKGVGKDGSNGACPGNGVQGSGVVGALVLQQDLGGDGGDVPGPGGVPPPSNVTDHGDDDKMWSRRRVVVPPVLDAMEGAGLHTIREYIRRYQATIV